MVNKWIKLSDKSNKWVDIDESNSSQYRWLNKPIYNKESLFCGVQNNLVELVGVGEVQINDGVIKLDVNDDIEDITPRPSCTIKVHLEKHDYRNYNRISLKIKPVSTGFVNFYMHISFGNIKHEIVHTVSAIPNVWNDVLFELEDTLRDDVKTINITPFLFGTPPEALPEVSFLIKDIYAEKVDEDYILGWGLQERIAYSHVGYFIDAKKEAIVEGNVIKSFYLKDECGNICFEGLTKTEEKNDIVYQVMDFTEYKKVGKYYLEIDERKTKIFEISDNPYLLSIWKSIQFLRTLRCGKEVERVHSACHLNCRTVSENSSVPNFGGWHDAGDVSQFEICTAEMAEALIDLSNTLKNSDIVLSSRLLEEAKIGTDWLLQTIFKNGERSLAVGYNIWRKNELSNSNEAVRRSVSEKGPFENFLACSCLLAMKEAYKEIDEIYSEWCYRIALLDYNTALDCYEKGLYTKRWGSNIDSMVAGIGASCSTKLYKITNDDKYLNDSIRFGKIIVKCQERKYIDNNKTITGFFYEDINHSKMFTFEHRGHEQNPIQGLVALCETFPNSEHKKSWEESIRLYAKYVTGSMKYSSVYNLLPAHVYHLDKFNMERFTIYPPSITKEEALEDLKNQARNGIDLGNDFYLRMFPVAIQRRGYHATLLSKTKAVSLIARYLNDKVLKQIAIDQLEWVMGKNPFSSSTMYGEGYNYHPLYVAYSPQLVGSLPVGIKTKNELDLPYWPTVNNAVFKEIWGHTTGKYLYIFVDLLYNQDK